MWIKRPFQGALRGDDIARSEITPRAVFEHRRRVLQAAGIAAAGGLLGGSGAARRLPRMRRPTQGPRSWRRKPIRPSLSPTR